MRTAVPLRRRRRIANAALACAILACCALIFFPPTRFAIYPQCLMHEYLGILCPGCGAAHALAALLHGQLREALRFNALFVLLLPFALSIGIRAYLRAIRPSDFRWPRVPTPAFTALLLAATVFTVTRNVMH